MKDIGNSILKKHSPLFILIQEKMVNVFFMDKFFPVVNRIPNRFFEHAFSLQDTTAAEKSYKNSINQIFLRI